MSSLVRLGVPGALLLCFAGPPPALAADAPPLVLEATIPLPHTTGRIDHLAMDLRRNRIFVAELGNGSVDVVDLDRRLAVHRLSGLKEPQGVLHALQPDRLVVASAGDGTVRLFSAYDFSPQGTVNLGHDADNVRLAPGGQMVIVGYGRGGLAIIDPAHGALEREVSLPVHPEGFQLASDGRAYVNLPDAGDVAVVDLKTGTTTAIWKFPGMSGNFPMALGEPGIVAVAFRSPSQFVRIDQDTGREVSRSNLCGDADDVFFDGRRQRYYVSCGEGAVATFHVDRGKVTALPAVLTAGGARTSLFVPELDRMIVAVRAGLLGSNAELRVMLPTP